MTTDWSSALYMEFADERSRPARDLLAAVPPGRDRVVDLGCGPGNSTELLHLRFPDAEILGVDNSPEMLAAARKRLPAVRFVQADVATWTPGSTVDLIFANALFQWVPDHLAVLARLMGELRAGGVLAIQVPDNADEPTHRLMRETAEEGPWAERFAAPITRDAIPPPAIYYDRLTPLAATIDIWRTTYYHPLADAAAIVTMVESTGLRPYLARLEADERVAFLNEYRRRIAAAYAPLSAGRVLLRFPRLFVVATKGPVGVGH
jgi:trans-aconitate 2-methyltransferase